MFTKKHYEEIAKVIRRQRNEEFGNKDGMAAMIDVTEQFADMFEADNSNFNRGRFIQACEITE